jgi:hypothetical protein
MASQPPPPSTATTTTTTPPPVDEAPPPEPTYEIKRVRFFGRDNVAVFCQNVNGPCPLLAIANVLSLRNRLPSEALPPGSSSSNKSSSSSGAVVKQSRLVAAVADRLVAACDELRRLGGGAGSDAAGGSSDENAAAVLSDAIDALGALATGLDVNVRFASPLAFEPTRETSVFDLLGIPLLHGWVPDPVHEREAFALSLIHI